METTATLSLPGRTSTRRSTSKLAFAGHYGEMVLVMVLGMSAFGALGAMAFAAGNSSLSDQSASLQVMMMGAYMTVPMAAWMAYRGHTMAQNAEMAASMIVPTAVAATVAFAGAAGTEAALTLQHGIMLPAMLGVMLFRYAEYAQTH